MNTDELNLTAWAHGELRPDETAQAEALLTDPDLAAAADEHAAFCVTLDNALGMDDFELSSEERARVFSAFVSSGKEWKAQPWLCPVLAVAASVVLGGGVIAWILRDRQDLQKQPVETVAAERSRADRAMSEQLRQVTAQNQELLKQRGEDRQRLAELDVRLGELESQLARAVSEVPILSAPDKLIAAGAAGLTPVPEPSSDAGIQPDAAPSTLPGANQPALPASLQPYAARHAQERLAVATQRQKEFALWQARYLKTLNDTLTAANASSTGNGATIAITGEIEALKAGAIPTEMAADLPRSLATARKDFQVGIQTLDRAVAARFKEADARYLQALAGLDQQASRAQDAMLTAAISSERKRVGVAATADVPPPMRHNVIVNGSFTQTEPNGLPTGWKPRGEDWQGPSIPWANDAVVVQEGSEKFLRFRRQQSIRLANLSPSPTILIPPRAKFVAVSVRMRVEGLVPAKNFHIYPGVGVKALDAAGNSPGSDRLEATENTRWRKFTKRIPLSPASKTLSVTIGPWAAAGICDFDDLEVQFE